MESEIRSESTSRICFVIMPFSSSDSCTEEEWTDFFENLVKPSVEAANYDCRRSVATRGNLIKGIIQDLESSHVVLADLTDRNPNVFYELGVRHALNNRTILIAQERKFIPFDLQSYANHVYDWKSEDGRAAFTTIIADLLNDVDQDPDRSDNPVSDFLESPAPVDSLAARSENLSEIEARLAVLEGGYRAIIETGLVAKPPRDLASEIGDKTPFEELERGGSWFEIGELLSGEGDTRLTRRIVASTKQYIAVHLQDQVRSIDTSSTPDRVDRKLILVESEKYESKIAPASEGIERFVLGLLAGGGEWGTRALREVAGALIAAGEHMGGIRFATGLPSYMAWRLALVGGAYAVQNEDFNSVAAILNQPIPVEGIRGQATHRPLVQRRELFYPEAVLGYADLGVKFVAAVYSRAPHLQELFDSEESFSVSLVEFLVLVALRGAQEDSSPLYPGYRLLAAFARASSRIVSQISGSDDGADAVAQVLGMSGAQLKENWAQLARKANEAELGSGYWVDNRIPEDLGGATA